MPDRPTFYLRSYPIPDGMEAHHAAAMEEDGWDAALQNIRRLMGKEQFSYRITKNGKIFVYWHGTQGRREIVLKGKRTSRLIRDLPKMNPEEQQLALARSTGNFKRGNERRSGNV